MKETMHIISLRVVKHNERHNIFVGYSLEAGRVAMAVPAGSSRAASRLRALLMPMSVIECEADIRPGREVHTMGNVRAEVSLQSVYSHPVKSAVAMFLAEVLGNVLREGPADAAVWHYVASSVTALELLPAENVANFHLCFLYGLGACLGIAPDASGYESGMVFDMEEGVFRRTAPLHGHFLGPEEAGAVYAVGRLTYSNMHGWRLTREERGRVLDAVLQYYTLHYASLSGLRSVEVLRQL